MGDLKQVERPQPLNLSAFGTQPAWIEHQGELQTETGVILGSIVYESARSAASS